MMTMIAPKMSMRYSEKARRYSGARIRIMAAMTTPTMEPMPPSTTMERIMADSMKVKLAGLMKLVLAAKMTPAKPAQQELRAKADSLTRARLMPMASQAISSSRRACRARPTREFFRREITTMVMMTAASTM